MGSSKFLEADYQRALLARVAVEFPSVRFFRRNVGLVKMADGRMFRASIPGQCDLYGIGRGGHHFEVELKRFGKLSPDQTDWRDWCTRWRTPWLLLTVEKGELPGATIDRWVGRLRRHLVETGIR